jgi:hypothetical protein
MKFALAALFVLTLSASTSCGESSGREGGPPDDPSIDGEILGLGPSSGGYPPVAALHADSGNAVDVAYDASIQYGEIWASPGRRWLLLVDILEQGASRSVTLIDGAAGRGLRVQMAPVCIGWGPDDVPLVRLDGPPKSGVFRLSLDGGILRASEVQAHPGLCPAFAIGETQYWTSDRAGGTSIVTTSGSDSDEWTPLHECGVQFDYNSMSRGLLASANCVDSSRSGLYVLTPGAKAESRLVLKGSTGFARWNPAGTMIVESTGIDPLRILTPDGKVQREYDGLFSPVWLDVVPDELKAAPGTIEYG